MFSSGSLAGQVWMIEIGFFNYSSLGQSDCGEALLGEVEFWFAMVKIVAIFSYDRHRSLYGLDRL